VVVVVRVLRERCARADEGLLDVGLAAEVVRDADAGRGELSVCEVLAHGVVPVPVPNQLDELPQLSKLD
jgi:hypothetical protein